MAAPEGLQDVPESKDFSFPAEVRAGRAACAALPSSDARAQPVGRAAGGARAGLLGRD